MKRNIDILRELQREITAFKLSEEEMLLIMELEDTDLEELMKSDSEEADTVTAIIKRIGILLDNLTEDLRDTLDYEDFDCESYRWCLVKILHNPFELINYMESFSEAIASLDRIVEEYLREYKMFTQTAYNELPCTPPIHKKAGAV